MKNQEPRRLQLRKLYSISLTLLGAVLGVILMTELVNAASFSDQPGAWLAA